MRSNLCAVTLVVVSLVPFGLCCGCTDAVIFNTSYLAGIELSPAENGQQDAKVALQKFEGVAMPGCKDADSDGGWFTPCKEVLPQAYSTLALSYLDTGTLLLGGLTSVKITQVFATGKAATEAGDSGAAVNAFASIEGSYDDSATTKCIETWLRADRAHAKELKDWWTSKGLGGNGVLLIDANGNNDKRELLIREKSITCG